MKTANIIADIAIALGCLGAIARFIWRYTRHRIEREEEIWGHGESRNRLSQESMPMRVRKLERKFQEISTTLFDLNSFVRGELAESVSELRKNGGSSLNDKISKIYTWVESQNQDSA